MDLRTLTYTISSAVHEDDTLRTKVRFCYIRDGGQNH